MDVSGKVVVVTGGATGIGAALARRFTAEGAATVVIADIDVDKARRTAAELGGQPRLRATHVDVRREASLTALIDQVEQEIGAIDLFCSHAGYSSGRQLDASDEDWAELWNVNLMSHVYVARALVPRMQARGAGYLLFTSSAAGVLTHSDPAYVATKSALVSFAEWLSIWYGGFGIGVSVLVPRGVRTERMIEKRKTRLNNSGYSSLIEPAAVADAVLDGLAAEDFMIFDRPGTAESLVAKTLDREKWIADMRAEWATGPS